MSKFYELVIMSEIAKHLKKSLPLRIVKLTILHKICILKITPLLKDYIKDINNFFLRYFENYLV